MSDADVVIEDEEDLKEVTEQQRKYIELAAAGVSKDIPPHLMALHDSVRRTLDFSKKSGNWTERSGYEYSVKPSDVEELAILVLSFFRLEEYHYRILDATQEKKRDVAFARHLRGLMEINGNLNNKNFVGFLNKFLKEITHDIKKIHFAVLGLRMKIETESNPDDRLIDEYDRLLKLFYDVCSGMFDLEEVKKKKDEAALDDLPPLEPKAAPDSEDVKNEVVNETRNLPGAVVISMMSDYAFPVLGSEMFKAVTLIEGIKKYRMACGYVLLAMKIQRVFESLVRQRQVNGKTPKEKGLTTDQAEVYVQFHQTFSPFINDDRIHANEHVVRLNRLMMEILHVFGSIHDGAHMGKDYTEKWENDDHPHFISGKLMEFVQKIAVVCLRRRQLREPLCNADNVKLAKETSFQRAVTTSPERLEESMVGYEVRWQKREALLQTAKK